MDPQESSGARQGRVADVTGSDVTGSDVAGRDQPPVRPRRAAPPTGRSPRLVTTLLIGSLVLVLAGTGLVIVLGQTRPTATAAGSVTSLPTTVDTDAPSSASPGSGGAGPTVTAVPGDIPGSTAGSEVYRDLPAVVANPMYAMEPQPLECDGLALPAPEGSRLETWATAVLRCLHDHYAPIVTAAGHTLSMPGLTFFADVVDTPCGDAGSGAFYCADDEGIYVQRGLYTADEGRHNTVRMLLHEFTHHVQHRVGILGADTAGREPAAVISRRVELQASCWTGMQLRGSRWLDWDHSDEQWLERFNAVDSDDLHGSATARAYWYRAGRAGTTFGACTTWLADRGQVD